jgi:hypothetical protein
LPDSPALDAGNPAFDPADFDPPLLTDQRRYARLADGDLDGVARIDIGAYERNVAKFTVTTTDDELDVNYDPADLSLREAVELANQFVGDEAIVCLPAGEYRLTIAETTGDNRTGSIDIRSNVTLLGDGAVQTIIDAQRLSGVLSVYDDVDRAVVQGVTLRGASSYALVLYEESNTRLVDVTLTDNRGGAALAMGEGTTLVADNLKVLGNPEGGLYMFRPAAYVLIENSLFQQNQASEGAGIYAASRDMTLRNSQVRWNAASIEGGGIYNAGRLVLDNVGVTENHAPDGGGIANRGDLSVVNSWIEANTAERNGGGIAGGVLLDRSVVRNNSAGAQGGGIHAGDENIVRISDGALEGNFAGQRGGGIFAGLGQIDVQNTVLSQNVASSRGGAIAIERSSNLTLNGSQLIGNSAGAWGGAIFNEGSAIQIDDSTLAGNVAGELPFVPPVLPEAEFASGGAIYNLAGPDSAHLTIRRSTLSNNSARRNLLAPEAAHGGAIYSTSSGAGTARVTISDSILEGNTAGAPFSDLSHAAGGAIYNFAANGSGDAELSIERSQLRHNRVDAAAFNANAEGGAIYNNTVGADAVASVYILESTIAQNVAVAFSATHQRDGARGGAIYNFAGPDDDSVVAHLTIERSTLSGNSAQSFSGDAPARAEGGAVWSDSVETEPPVRLIETTILSSTFSGNIASAVSDDDAFAYGGGIYNGRGLRELGPALAILHSTIVNNEAFKTGSTAEDAAGGGLFTWQPVGGTTSDTIVDHSIIAGNQAIRGEPFIDFSDVEGAFASQGYNLIGVTDGSSGFGAVGDQTGTFANPLDPLLGPLGNYGGPTQTHLPLPGSPVIDRGDPSFNPDQFEPPLTTDQRGLPRVVSSPILDRLPIVDIGAVELQNARVLGRQVFYNNSAFDGNDPAANVADDAAIAPDKQALLPGGTASFANYTSYSRGINGLVIDVAELLGVPTAADFGFKIGNNNDPASWAALPTAPSVSVRTLASGASRVTLIWPDNTLRKTWLEVKVLPTLATGLGSADVFYFGNAVGEVGNSTTNAAVNSFDEGLIRLNGRSALNPAPLDFAYDINRDGRVNSADQVLARLNATSALTALRLIVPPAGAAAGTSADLASLLADEQVQPKNRRRRT